MNFRHILIIFLLLQFDGKECMDDHRTDIDQLFLHQLTEITEENLANEHFSVDDLASAMGMSHTKLYRKLKCLSHQTISQFIREIRLQKAHEILLNEDVTASEVSYRTGFGSPAYFSKCFHEYYGYSPLEFRKRELKKEQIHFIPHFTVFKREIGHLLVIIALAIIALFSFFILMNNKNGHPSEGKAMQKVIARFFISS